jgi:hypothetical protein
MINDNRVMKQTPAEHDIQTEIQIGISEQNIGRSFRINVGTGWTGNKITRNRNGSITIKDPRPFSTFGAQTKSLTGFSDLLVITPIIITPEMVGQQFARAGFIEVKKLTGRPTKDQLNFIDQMQKLGARAGVARSIEDVKQILC